MQRSCSGAELSFGADAFPEPAKESYMNIAPRLPLRRRIGMYAAAVVLVAALAPGRIPPAGAQQLPIVRIDSTMADDLTPVYYAVHTGMYKKAGIDVELTISPTGSAVAEAVVAGSEDLGKSSLVNLMNAHDHGVPIELTTPGAMYDARAPFAEMVVATASPMKNAVDLSGKLIGVPYLNDFNELAAKMWFAKSGGNVADLKFVEIPNSAQAAAIGQHRIDAAILQEPDLSEALATGKVRVFGLPYSAISTSFMFSAWFAKKTWVDRHASLLATFNRVTAQATEMTNAHPEASAAMMSEATKIPLAVMTKMRRVKSATTLEPSMLQPLIDAAAKNGAIPRAFSAATFIFNPQIAAGAES
jgi:NitT/TauT family transport system substrate-binding protein